MKRSRMSESSRWYRSVRCLALAIFAVICATPVPTLAQFRVLIIPPGEPALASSVLPRDVLPDSHVGHGANDIVQAWLAMPTTRYAHGILGDKIEAGALRVKTRAGAVLSYVLPLDSVFEDLIPRVHDIDGGSRDEVLLVRSRLQSGSSLMALGIRDGKLVPIAETEPIGREGLWMNPVGVADIDGDGRLEVLVVLTPHIGGTLVEYSFDGAVFKKGHSVDGVSNHVAGSRDQGMSALMDVNGDGIADVVVPAADRLSIRAFAFDEKRPLEFTRIGLPARASGNFVVIPPNTLLVPLEDGRRMRIDWR